MSAPPAQGVGRRRNTVRSVVAVACIVTVMTGCTGSEPSILRESDFEGVVSAAHNERFQSYVPGMTWCERLVTTLSPGPISELWFDEDKRYPSVGAKVLDESMSALADKMQGTAASCVEAVGEDPERTLEPLTGLSDGAIGWRTQRANGVWGELRVVPLDDSRVLLLGFETDESEPPVPLDDLIRLAREGAERVGLDD